MALYETVWYCNAGDQSTTGYYAVTKRPQNTAVVAGQIVRQFTAPTAANERCFICIVAGTTANTTDATWVLTRGAKTTDGTATWQECTGIAAVNGDITNTVDWTAAKAIGVPTLGAIIKRNSAASYQICTTAGTMAASEPSFSNTAGVTTNDGTSVWTSLGPVGNFTGGQAPHKYIGAVATVNTTAGGTVYVGDNHAETLAGAYTIAYTNASATPTKIICHNHSGSYPPAASDLATTATASTTAAGNFTVNLAGHFYVYGVTFTAGVGLSTTASLLLLPNGSFNIFESCNFKLASTGIGSIIQLNLTNSSAMSWNNCKVSFANTGQAIDIGVTSFTWQNTGTVLMGGSSVPSGSNGFLYHSANFRMSSVILEALDLSQITSLFSPSLGVTASQGNWVIKDCKLHASATFANPALTGHVVQIVRADGGATAYKSARYAYEGSETTETSITRVGGASDPTGQAQSRKIVTTANSQWLRPFAAEEYAIWNATTGTNVTVTVYGTINAGAVPNNDDIWIELEYLGSSATPVGTIVDTTKANLYSSNAAVSSDGSSWNGGGSGAGWSPFKLTTTLSSPQPAMAGYLNVRVRAAKASTTYYVDPKIELT